MQGAAIREVDVVKRSRNRVGCGQGRDGQRKGNKGENNAIIFHS